MTTPFLMIGTILQATTMAMDEFIFHRKRGLPLWERIGHPIDTASLLLCLFFILLFPFSQTNLKVYSAMAIFSVLCITKDEWVHKRSCEATEQWVHAILFILHPVILFLMAEAWPQLPTNLWLKNWVVLQTLVVLVFWIYQIFYWNFLWKKPA